MGRFVGARSSSFSPASADRCGSGLRSRGALAVGLPVRARLSRRRREAGGSSGGRLIGINEKNMTLRNSIAPLVAACFVAVMAMSAASAPLAARPARVSPSFDCAKAATKVEKTICGSPSLSGADAEVATLYRQRRHELSPAAAALLANDQRYLLTSRERIFGYGYTDSAGLLGDVLAGRADFLRRLTVPSGDGLAGRWDNVTGG